ncbi:GDSL-like lipase/acylhydrolase [Clostridium puniceum]|uniref:GDSL-like lipase/acylhydrolase n=1 Tax=Clostridium puniceum TaxID=29367 RepID=A0A1S8TXM7_9CLOT|nr:GDSL-type esterase/lipase family protein [Clostridium puniceum]OOM82352.1 GDSL-like lipase/acylhydrolase [Clostridium puniceum]
MINKERRTGTSEGSILSIREKRKKLIVRKRRRRLASVAIIVACVIITSIVIANQREQKQVMAADNIISTESAEEIKNSVETEKENVITEKDKKENVNGEKVASDEPIAQSNESSNNMDANYSQFFKKDVFIGDSITEGMSDYDFLDEENVCAKLGLNLTQVDPQIEKAKNLKPRRIFLLLGANDIEYSGTTPEIFKERYIEVIHKVKVSIPNSKIYVQSILPVLPQASRSNQLVNNTRIGKFNTVIKAMASEENITYLNIDALVKDSNKNLYEQDGIHFKSKFYTLWLDYIKLNTK